MYINVNTLDLLENVLLFAAGAHTGDKFKFRRTFKSYPAFSWTKLDLVKVSGFWPRIRK